MSGSSTSSNCGFLNFDEDRLTFFFFFFSSKIITFHRKKYCIGMIKVKLFVDKVNNKYSLRIAFRVDGIFVNQENFKSCRVGRFDVLASSTLLAKSKFKEDTSKQEGKRGFMRPSITIHDRGTGCHDVFFERRRGGRGKGRGKGGERKRKGKEKRRSYGEQVESRGITRR